ncbi:hypothetical protein C1646_776250 [Rhizophagus diaphanus]|nr:hypothetical protein C1646_776250 [Rhizophagus diaphanus] [Rhizophagus sp. MUCL 43196]
MVVQLGKNAELEIVYLETGDVLELYAMRKELGIYKYCLIEEVTIPLHMTSLSAVYPLIHALITLRMAIACTIHKILYSSDSGDSEHSSSEMASSIHPKMKDLLNKAVGNYIKQKERQKMKPITNDCETLLRQENEELCISKQVLEKKIEELFKLQEQYKSHEIAITSIIPDMKKAIASAEKSIDVLENKCWHLEDIISAKDTLLKMRDVGQCITESASYEKIIWKKIEIELEEINIENLRFDHPICLGVLDIKLEPFSNMPGSVSDIFKELFRKYKLEQNHDIMEACKEFIQNEESKINMNEVLGNINYVEWLDKPEELQDLTK